MKIIYKPNPLETIVELDERDKEILRWRIIAHKLEERLFDISSALEEVNDHSIFRAKQYATLTYDDEYKTEIDKYADKWTEIYANALKEDHVGDCTCVPASCLKCHAENYLDIDTLEGLGKHEAGKIFGAFGAFEEDSPTRSIDDVLEILKNYDPKANWEGWEAHAPRWIEEAKRAYEWLLNYKNTKLASQEELSSAS